MNMYFESIPLSNVAVLYDSLHKTPKYLDDGYPMLRVTDITRGYINLANTKKIDRETYEDFSKKHKPQVGDVILTRVGSYGNSCYANRKLDFCLGQNTVCVAPNRQKIVPFYLFCCLNSPFVRNQIESIVGGASQPTISLKNINKLEIPYPRIDIQEEIADILSAYDDLIENNQRRIKILEDMARSLYREWFVNFRFPGHESVKFVDSPLGKIPEGWEVKSVSDCLYINPKVTVPKSGEKPFVPMGCLSTTSMIISDIESRAGNSGSKFQNGDTLFARITPSLENGKTGFVQFLPNAGDVAFGSTEFIVLRSKSLTQEFVYCLARDGDFRGNAIKSMVGASGRQRVQEACFRQFRIAQAPPNLLERFSTITAPSFRNVRILNLRNDNLRRTRDLLLPRLVSGQIDVSTVEKEQENAA